MIENLLKEKVEEAIKAGDLEKVVVFMNALIAAHKEGL